MPLVTSTRFAKDLWGQKWMVTRALPTKHGFEVLLGKLVGEVRQFGRPRVVVTTQLASYLRERSGYGEVRELPLSRATITDIYAKLDINCVEIARSWWVARKSDLATLTSKEFAAKHGCSTCMPAAWRKKLNIQSRVGRKGWLNDPKIRDMLFSGALPDTVLMEAWDISPAYLRVMRWKAKRNDEIGKEA